MLRLARYLKYFKKEVTFGPFFKLMEAIFELIVPLVMASVIDIGIKSRNQTYVLERGGIIFLLGVVGLIFALICQYSAARASQGFGTRVRNDLFAHINTLSHKELEELGTSTLITVITNDVNQMQLAVAMLIRLVVRAPFLVIGATVMAMLLDLKLSLIFLIVAPIVAFLLYYIMKRSIPFYRGRQKILDQISQITRENLAGARVIRAFSRQEKERQRFQATNEEAADIAVRVSKLSALLSPSTFLVMNGAIVAILWFGGLRADTGELTQGEIVAFVNYMTQISLALVVVANLVVIFTKASASAARINKVFDTKPSMQEGSDEVGNDHSSFNPYLSFQRVAFSYPSSDEYALEDINIDINQGEWIGIIGGTGSGKSTLVNLILRFYEVSKGSILLEGKPIKSYPYKVLRNQVQIVPQKAVLFSGSIVENMRIAKQDASLEEIKRAIEFAQAKEFVEQMPDQYETKLSQGGNNLSGGQKQRLTIARALLNHPKVLILDDSSSALDYATDARLQLALRENCKDTTVLMVSQRAASIKQADKIIVLEDGRMVGIGTHLELLQNCEIYKEICLSQLGEQEVNLS